MTKRNDWVLASALSMATLFWLAHPLQAQTAEDHLRTRLLEISQVSQFSWSPGGNHIAYVSNTSGNAQIHLLDLEKMNSRQLTRSDSPASDPQWSPDGNSLIFLSEPGWQERYEIWKYDLQGSQQRLLPDLGAIQRNVRWSPDGSRIVLETNAGGNFDLALWSPTEPTLRPLVRTANDETSPAWSPDGTSVAFLSRGAIWKVNASGGEPESLVDPGLGAAIQAPEWSPDGTHLLFRTDLQGYWNIGVYSVASKQWKFIAPEDREQSDPSWSPDGQKIAFISTQGFDKRVVIADWEQGNVRYVTSEGAVCASPLWSPDGARLAFLMSTPRQSWDLWVHEQGEVRQLTDSMAGWTPEQFSMAESHSFPSKEGLPIPGLLYRPRDFQPGRRYPAIIQIHGGFDGQWVNSMDVLGQYFMQRGVVVFYPNPRGSGGYGRMYERLNDGDWGSGDVDDLILAHEYLKSLPFVDADRVAIWGGSYGGYLSFALVAFAPGRFQAAVVRAGISDLRSHIMERRFSPARFNPSTSYPRQLGGMPDENPDFFRDRSPLTYVRNVKTPMLVMHGLRDDRVPPSQSRMWVKALQEQGVPVESVEYPDDDHSLTRNKATMTDQLKRMSELFRLHLGLESMPGD